MALLSSQACCLGRYGALRRSWRRRSRQVRPLSRHPRRRRTIPLRHRRSSSSRLLRRQAGRPGASGCRGILRRRKDALRPPIRIPSGSASRARKRRRTRIHIHRHSTNSDRRAVTTGAGSSPRASPILPHQSAARAAACLACTVFADNLVPRCGAFSRLAPGLTR